MAQKRRQITATPTSWRATSFAPIAKPPRKIELSVSSPVHAEPNYDRPCMPPKKGKKKGVTRQCHVEFAALGDKLAKKYGVEPGLFLRACERPHEHGRLVAVRDHAEANKIAREICACRTSGGGSTKRCA